MTLSSTSLDLHVLAAGKSFTCTCSHQWSSSSKYSQVKDVTVTNRAKMQSAKRSRTQSPNLRFSSRTHPDPVYLLEKVGTHMGTMVL